MAYGVGLLGAIVLAATLMGGVAFCQQLAAPGSVSNAAPPTPQVRSSSPPQAQSEAGLEAPWDVRKILTQVGNDTQQFQPVLAQMNPQQWYNQKGAPSTYIVQWQTAQRQVNDVLYSIRQLSQKTDSLPLALDTYFRLEALDVTARSLDEGAQRYANRATADKLNALIAHNFNNRERLRDYIRDLAASTEQNFKIADDEAQRCRAMITNVPAAASKRSKKY
jgi:hypothetical protein